jgi:hypothetical protein
MCNIEPGKPAQRINFEDVKQCPEFSHLTDEQAQEIAETIQRFTEIVYNYSSRTIKEATMSERVIELPIQKNKAA